MPASANEPFGLGDEVALEVVLRAREVEELLGQHHRAEEAGIGVLGVEADGRVELGPDASS